EMFRMVLPPRLARWGEVFERRVAPPFYRRSTLATLSESSRQEILARLGMRPDRVAVVPPGLDDRFRPDASRRAAEPTVVAVGRLVPAKRHDLLIRAAATAREAVPGLRLRIVGEGYELEHLEALIDALGVREWVELVGRLD